MKTFPTSLVLGVCLLTGCSGPSETGDDVEGEGERLEPLGSLRSCDGKSAGGKPSGLSYTGGVKWDEAAGVLTFTSSGKFPEGTSGQRFKEFHYRPPGAVKKIVICPDTRVTGHFIADHDLVFKGRDRKTSVIYGTDKVEWSHSEGRNLPEWEYSAIAGEGSGATIKVRDLTIRNARSYAISGWDQKVDVARVDLIHDRANDRDGSNSDGVQGGPGSLVKDSYIAVGDDAIKVYDDITVQDVVIDLDRNGAPIQLGWDQYGSRSARGVFQNLTINAAAPDDQYNLALVTWVNDDGRGGTKTLDIDGLTVSGFEAAERWNGRGFEPYPLIHAPMTTGTIEADIRDASISVGQFGVNSTRGTFRVCGSTAERASYECR